MAAVAVSLAGVTYNFLMALIASSILPIFYPPHGMFEGFMFLLMFYLVVVNVILAVFNLWPVPPLDGANAVKYLALQFKWYKIAEIFNKLEPYGMILLLIILFTPLSNYFFCTGTVADSVDAGVGYFLNHPLTFSIASSRRLLCSFISPVKLS
jgi:Zn-dependent protease